MLKYSLPQNSIEAIRLWSLATVVKCNSRGHAIKLNELLLVDLAWFHLVRMPLRVQAA